MSDGTAQDVVTALRKRYAAPEWAFFTEVGDSTGWSVRRHADALAMNLWPSRGMELHGFEVKISRSDLVRELRDPAKSAPIQRFCDRWWVVATERVGIVATEIPPTWGLLRLRPDGKWKIDVEAPKLVPDSLTREFVAAVMRRASIEDPAKAALDDARAAGHAAGFGAGQKWAEDRIENYKREADELRLREREFEAAAGIRFAGWDTTASKAGAAVHLALLAGRLEDRLRRLQLGAASVAEEARTALERLQVQEEPA